MFSFLRRRTSALAEGALVAVIVAMLAGLAGMTAFAMAAPQSQQAMSQVLEGVLSVRHGDNFTTGKIAGHAYFLTNTGGETELSFQGDPPDDAMSGARVRVHGVAGSGRQFLVAAGGTQQLSGGSASSTVSTGTKRVAIVLINFSNDTSQPYTPAFASGVAFTNANSVAAYYAASSWGQLTLSGEVFGWYTIPDTNLVCSTSTFAASATTAATAAGVDLSGYDNVVYAFPTVPSCAWAGMAQMPGRASWLNGAGAMGLHTMAHELGHNFGTNHASTLNCTVAGIRVSLSANSSDCSPIEYGDPFSVMGQATQYQQTNYSRGNFGWLQPANTATVTSTGDYLLQPIEYGDATAVQALRITRTSNTFFTLEFRQASTSFDTFSQTMSVVKGVSIRITSGYTVLLQSQLVDTTPSTASFMDAPLVAGNTLIDPLTGISITTIATSASGATVHINFGAAPAPTPTPTPIPTPTPTPTASPTPTPDPTPTPNPSPTPDPTPIPTPSPTPTPNADAQPPTTPTGLSANLAKGKKVGLYWSPSSDNVGVAGYRIYRNGLQVGTSSGTSFADTLSGKGATATYDVVAFDLAGNISAASQPVSVSP